METKNITSIIERVLGWKNFSNYIAIGKNLALRELGSVDAANANFIPAYALPALHHRKCAFFYPKRGERTFNELKAVSQRIFKSFVKRHNFSIQLNSGADWTKENSLFFFTMNIYFFPHLLALSLFLSLFPYFQI